MKSFKTTYNRLIAEDSDYEIKKYKGTAASAKEAGEGDEVKKVIATSEDPAVKGQVTKLARALKQLSDQEKTLKQQKKELTEKANALGVEVRESNDLVETCMLVIASGKTTIKFAAQVLPKAKKKTNYESIVKSFMELLAEKTEVAGELVKELSEIIDANTKMVQDSGKAGSVSATVEEGLISDLLDKAKQQTLPFLKKAYQALDAKQTELVKKYLVKLETFADIENELVEKIYSEMYEDKAQVKNAVDAWMEAKKRVQVKDAPILGDGSKAYL